MEENKVEEAREHRMARGEKPGAFYDPETAHHTHWAVVEWQNGSTGLLSSETEAGLMKALERWDNPKRVLLILEGKRRNFLERRTLSLQ